MWCANCNRVTSSNTCEICGNKTQQEIPTDLYWCSYCHVPMRHS